MRRVVASLPDGTAELCLVRMGFQVRGLSGWFHARTLRAAIARDADRAVAEGAGLLGSEPFTIARGHFGVLQYWRSFDALDAWSHRPPHSEWWRAAVDRMRRKQDLGVYHEVFLVPAANLESIYLDCEPAGLARFGKLGEPVGPSTTARGRLGMMRR
ncbi:MAG: phenylacetaldoxime dehydratase family protein [Paludisphaera borealis]|uniref:phenylacetaldoxime dehydratase family protein n=1 Tax=Paludisphaera borealis TaxID=1387353 RepID=UPI002850D554|nr:phenylacetaldoxime dehydratase family protein [Paludisphaera borealis]MDR3620030.1 phenylacetaldoxime dehydratase family protein [Paludisphaera borealis]